MTKLLEEAIESVRALPESEQDLVAKFLLAFSAPLSAHYQLTDAQVAEVERARIEVREGKVATDDEMADVWQRFAR